jgi:tripartite-type tricarboxylate transporter receptor subunit TctC
MNGTAVNVLAIRTVLCLGAMTLFAACTAAASGIGYPQRPIHVVVPNAAGGSIDLVTRAVAQRISDELGQPIVIDNRDGASGIVGALLVKAAAPDGYTLLASSTSTNTLVTHTHTPPPFDGVRDFAPIVNIAYTTKMIIVNSALPVKTLAELIDYLRLRPGELNYSSTGIGSSSQLDTEMFCDRAHVQLTHVPYRTATQAAAAVAANEVQVSLGSITAGISFVRAGQARALAVIAQQRSPLLPDVPTIAEAGLPNLEIRTWIGLSGPKGTPAAVVGRLNSEINRVLADPAMHKWMEQRGLEAIGGSSADFARTVATDDAKWAAEIHKLGLDD